MVSNNGNRFSTAFTVSIEAASGVTTGVSAADRVRTIRAAIADGARPEDLNRPGHVFPLKARPGGVLERRGHTEAAVDLMRLAGLKPYGVICELTNPDGSMARLTEVVAFARRHQLPVTTIEDVAAYRSGAQSSCCQAGSATVTQNAGVIVYGNPDLASTDQCHAASAGDGRA
jgi:3,4-dihydroxy 2-butanone 4-phosphate synthase